jgi:hypothetical protein
MVRTTLMVWIIAGLELTASQCWIQVRTAGGGHTATPG